MSLKNLAVYVDNDAAAPQRIELALRLAQQHGAHLSAVYARRPMYATTYVGTYIPADVRAQLQQLADDEEPPTSATALLGDLRLLVPMKGMIDVDAERARLEKQKQKVEADLARTTGKLANEKFVNNAPADVVTQERQREAEFAKTIAQLDEQLEKLTKLS